MEAAQNTVPIKENEDDIRLHLQRVLANKRFIRNVNSSTFLALIVDAAMKGEEEKQTTLALKLFRVCTVKTERRVRATAMQLRALLTEYYDGQGRGDRIIIMLPKPPDPNAGERHPAGMPYTPIFLYNSRSPAVAAYEEGLQMLQLANSSHLEDYIWGVVRLVNAIDLDPNYAAAYAAWAEMEIWEPMYRQFNPQYNPIQHAELLAKQALRLRPGFWHAHMVLGAVHSCRYQWKQAQICFDVAMEAARDKVLDHPWYPAFLLATGRQEEALRIANARVAEKPGSMSARLALVFFLCVSHNNQALKQITDGWICTLPENWLVFVIEAFLHVSTRDLFSVERQFESIKRSIFSSGNYMNMQHTPYVFPGLHFLGRMQSKFPGFADREREMDTSDESLDLRLAGYLHRYREFPKTRHFAERAAIYDSQKMLEVHYSDDYHFWTPLQCAIAYMAKKDVQNAIHCLQCAMDDGDPLTVFLHMLPFFDPLRDEPGFQKLIKRMRLPHQMKSP